MTESIIDKWKQAAQINGTSGAAAEIKETIALKKRVKELEAENEIKKKAALIFGRGN